MKLLDLLHSLRFVLEGRFRTFLTLLGIVIGSGSIVLLACLLRGGEDALVRASQEAADADLVEVRKDRVGFRDRSRTRRELSRGDAELLSQSSALGQPTALGESTRRTEAFASAKKKMNVSLVSGSPVARDLYRLDVTMGRFLDARDLSSRRRVCVVGHEVWKKLLAERDSLDESVSLRVEGHPWVVIGVLADQPIIGSTDSTDIWNRKVIVPETTYDALFSPSHQVDRIYVRRDPADRMRTPLSTLRDVVSTIVQRRHYGVKNFKLGEDRSSSQEHLILDVIKLLLMGTGFVSLIVGGINIMNIMLVTVTERTKEIGIRRAVGASPRAILSQFLLEATAVSLIGGLLGVGAGLGLAWLLSLVLTQVIGQWNFSIELWAMGLGLGLAAFTGIVFGFYPAWRASRLHPIEALRTE